VIYLSLIITLKRGVVVLWLPVVGHYHLRVSMFWFLWFYFYVACLGAHAHQASNIKVKPKKPEHRYIDVLVSLDLLTELSSEVYIDILYPYILS